MKKFTSIFLSFALIVSFMPKLSSFRQVEAVADETPTFSNVLNGEQGANFTGAINWLNERNAFPSTKDVTIAILDDGVDISNPYIDETRFIEGASKSFIPGEPDSFATTPPSSSDGHGTQVASVIGGKNGIGALCDVPGVNYISYRYYEYDKNRDIDDDTFRAQLLAALDAIYKYATEDERGDELKVVLITGSMSRYVKSVYDEGGLYVKGSAFEYDKPRSWEWDNDTLYFYDSNMDPDNNPTSEDAFKEKITQDLELEAAINRLRSIPDNGVSVVVAEDNILRGVTMDSLGMPVACPAYVNGAFGVTACDANKSQAKYTKSEGNNYQAAGYSPNTDIAGYGTVVGGQDWVVAVSGRNQTATNIGKTSGTSIAAAQVAAGIALAAKARSVGILYVDWSGVEAETKIADEDRSLDSYSTENSAFNGSKGILNVYNTISKLADNTHYHTFEKDWSGKNDTGHWHTCSSSNCDNRDGLKDLPGAEFTEHTFRLDGRTCTVCGYEKPCEHIHTVRKDAKASTCKTEGSTGYLYCNDCKTVIDPAKPCELDPNNHEGPYTPVDKLEPTCKTQGHTAYKICTACNEKIGYEVLKKVDHKDNGNGVCVWCGTVLKKTAVTKIDTSNVQCGSFTIRVNGKNISNGTKVKQGDMIEVIGRTWNSGTNISVINNITINGTTVFNKEAYNKSAWVDGSNNVNFDRVLNYVNTDRLVSTYYVPVVASGSTFNISISTKLLRPVYRLYNEITSEHLFTDNKGEYDTFSNFYYSGRDRWKPEGIDWFSAVGEGRKVIRLYNPGLGRLFKSSHYYTSSWDYAQSLTKNGWQIDSGIDFYDSGDIPVYTCYNERLRSAHHYTANYGEYVSLADAGWDLEPNINGFPTFDAIKYSKGSGMFKCIMGGR